MNLKNGKIFVLLIALLSLVSACGEEERKESVPVKPESKLELQKIPEQKFPAGDGSLILDLKNYLIAENIDESKLIWSSSNSKNLKIKISRDGKAEIYLKDPRWSGKETVLFRVSYRDSLFSETEVTFAAERPDYPPELRLPKSLSFNEDEEFYPIDLTQYVFDYDGSFNELTFDFKSENLSVEKAGKYLFVKSKMENWNGTDDIIISVTDKENKSATQKITVVVNPVNDKPAFAKIPSIIITEKETFPELDLKKYLSDADNSPNEFSFKAFEGKYLQAEVDKNGIAIITRLKKDWTGKDTLTFAATDAGNLTAYSDVEFIVEPVNDPPKIIKIPNQIIFEGENFEEINLNDYVFDPDDKAESLKWKISGSGKIRPEVSDSNLLILNYPEDWTGSDTLTFIAKDKGGLADTSFAVFTVEEKPLLKTEPYKTVVNIGLTAVEDVVLMATQPVRWDLRDWITFGSVAGGTYLLTLVDEDVRAIAKRNDRLIDSPLLEFGRFYGETNTSYYASGAFAAYGLVLQDKTAFRIGLEIFESYFIANTITSWLKAGIGRSRPYLEEGPKEYNPFNAKNNSQKSLPSGHTTLAFSLSSVLAAHVDEWYWKALIFTPAVLTAAQRVIYDRHWFSDVFLGASIGYFVGTFLVNRHTPLMGERFSFYLTPRGEFGISYHLK